jgi:hypothetical protein
VALVVNPTAPTYPTRSLYVAPWEFLNAPTGVDTTQLVPGGTTQANQAALVLQLTRASALADNLCQKVLAATVDTQYGRYRVQADSWLGPVVKVPLDYTPIVAVASVSYGWTPSSLAALSSLADVAIHKKTATIPLAPSNTLSGPLSTSFGSHAHVSVSYVNGWANTSVNGAVAAGATSVPVASDLGIVPGQQLRLASASNSEVVTVASSYTATANGTATSVPITSGTVGTYASGDTATALPQDIKQAVILLTKALIKTRASQSLELPRAGGDTPGPEHSLSAGVSSDYDLAIELLAPYRRAV